MILPPEDPSIVNVSVSKVKLLSELIADVPLPVKREFEVKVLAPVPPSATERVPLIALALKLRDSSVVSITKPEFAFKLRLNSVDVRSKPLPAVY